MIGVKGTGDEGVCICACVHVLFVWSVFVRLYICFVVIWSDLAMSIGEERRNVKSMEYWWRGDRLSAFVFYVCTLGAGAGGPLFREFIISTHVHQREVAMIVTR